LYSASDKKVGSYMYIPVNIQLVNFVKINETISIKPVYFN